MSLQTKLYIRFLDQPRQGDNFHYTININGTPLSFVTEPYDYTDKTFNRSITIDKFGNIASVNANIQPNQTWFNDRTGGFNGEVTDIAKQSDGKLIVVGSFTTFCGVSANGICRLNINGTLDNSFTPPNRLIVPGNRVVVDKTDRIYVFGLNTTTPYHLRRLNSDGSIDSTFNVNLNSQVTALVVQPDNKIIIGGLFTTITYAFTNVTRNRIIRLHTDGFIDNTFVVGNGFDSTSLVTALEIDDEGFVYVGGRLKNYNGFTLTAAGSSLIKLTPTGIINNIKLIKLSDHNGSDSKLGDVNVIKYSENKIYVGGKFQMFVFSENPSIPYVGYNLVKFSKNLVASESEGYLVGEDLDYVKDIDINSNGDIVFGGSFSEFNLTDNTTVTTPNVGRVNSDFNVSYGSATSWFPTTPPVYVNTVIMSGDADSFLIGGFFVINSSTTALNDRLNVLIGDTVNDTQTSTLNNLRTFNVHPQIDYQSVANTIEVTITHENTDSIYFSDIRDTPHYVEIIAQGLEGESEFILADSPFFVKEEFTEGTVDEMIAKLYIYKGHYLNDEPQNPTYILNKSIVKPTQTCLYFNISNYIKEFLQTNIGEYSRYPSQTITPLAIEESVWVKVDLITYRRGVEQRVTTKKYLGIDGYGWVEENVNPLTPRVLMKTDRTKFIGAGRSFIHFTTFELSRAEYRLNNETNWRTINIPLLNTLKSNEYIAKIKIQDLRDNNSNFVVDRVELKLIYGYFGREYVKVFERVGNCDNNPTEIYFKNKYGVLQTFPFEMKITETLELDSKTYKNSILREDATFDSRNPSIKILDRNSQRSFVVNTGNLDDNDNVTIQELINSSELYLYSVSPYRFYPVTLEDKSVTLRNSRNDKVYNYTLRLKHAQNAINDII